MSNTMFVNGDLEGKFIMDRNLGARDETFPEDAKGVLHYIFGRKDAFTQGVTEGDTITPAYKGRGENGDSDLWSIENSPAPVSLSTGVNNPMIMYLSTTYSNWCSDVDSEDYVWNDFEEDYRDNGKSIFDPSPKGWKVAPHGSWDGFTTSTMGAWVAYVSEGDQPGRSYPLADERFAYYPAVGFRNGTLGKTRMFRSRNFSYSSTPSSTTFSYMLLLDASTLSTSFTSGRMNGLTVRCVQHNE